MRSIEGIKSGIARGEDSQIIARKIYLSYATEIFRENEDFEFYIKDDIARKFAIPFSSIEIVGSSKTGISFIKESKFIPKKSDLDIAIISLPLFLHFSEMAHRLTKGYSDLTVFPSFKGANTASQFRNSMAYKGFVNPFFMPNCSLKSDWLEYFNSLSNSYVDLFKSINAGVYASEYYFESKQIECIENYTKNQTIYDKISS